MKTIVTVLLSVLLLAGAASAELTVLGVDDQGRQLIYDADLDITWLDYTLGPITWYDFSDRVDALEVTFNGMTYSDWRLPMTVDGSYAQTQSNGSGYSGWNITTSDLGHLYYVELGNEGSLGLDGIPTGCNQSCLTNTGPFQNLLMQRYWSSDHAGIAYYTWFLELRDGWQYVGVKHDNFYGMAVHPGRVDGTVPNESRTFGAVKAMYR